MAFGFSSPPNSPPSSPLRRSDLSQLATLEDKARLFKGVPSLDDSVPEAVTPTKLCFTPGFNYSKGEDVHFTATQFCDEVPAGTWFEVTQYPHTWVKPYFDLDFATDQPDVIPCELAVATQQRRGLTFIRSLFPEGALARDAINFCQRIKPGKISFHFTVSGYVTTKDAIKAKLKTAQGGVDNKPFDFAPYSTYQKFNAPGHAKMDVDGPQMTVVRGTQKDNLVSHLEGDEKEIYWGYGKQTTLDDSVYKVAEEESKEGEESEVEVEEKKEGENSREGGGEVEEKAVPQAPPSPKTKEVKSRDTHTKKKAGVKKTAEGKAHPEKQGAVTMEVAAILEQKLAVLEAPEFVTDSTGWRLITLSVKAMVDATPDEDVRSKLREVHDTWSQLSESTYDREKNRKTWNEMKNCGTYGLRYILAKAAKITGVADDPSLLLYNSEIATAFVDAYGDDFYFIGGKGELLVGLKYCRGNVWIEGGLAVAQRQGLMQGGFCDKMVAHLEAVYAPRIEAAKAEGDDAKVSKVEGDLWARINHPQYGMKKKLKEMGPERGYIEKAIDAELMRRKPTNPDDVRFNTQPENNDLLAFANGVLDMSKLSVSADGTVDWKGAFRDYHRSDHFLYDHRLPYAMDDVGQEHIDFANGMIDTILPHRIDPLLNQSMRGWLAYCTTGYTSAEKFMVWTGYDGENGKSKLAGMHMKSLPLYSSVMNGATMYEKSQDEHKHLAKCVRKDVRFALLEELDAKKAIDRQRLCHIVDGEMYPLKMLYTTQECSVYLHAKWNFTGNADPNLPNDGGVKRRAQQGEFVQKFVKEQEYKASNGDSNPNMHLQIPGILSKFDDKTNHDAKLGYLHCLLPSIVAFYKNGKKPAVDQKFSDAAKENFDEACWLTTAINDNLRWTNVVNDKHLGGDKVEWKKPTNWITPGEIYEALMKHQMAKAHSSRSWETVWKEAKVKCARLRLAYDKDKMVKGKKGNFFGVRKSEELETADAQQTSSHYAGYQFIGTSTGGSTLGSS
jgi:hypothetical protein